MKKTLNHIFDEANAGEIENLVKQNAAPEVPVDTLSSIKDKVYAKTNLKKERKPNKSVWLRFGAIAACFLLIVSAVIVVPMLREDNPGVEPYIPNGEPWIPTINSNVRDIVLSADDVGNVFDAVMDSNGTNQYTKIYTSLPEYLGITPKNSVAEFKYSTIKSFNSLLEGEFLFVE